ncbi:DNA recombination protein RmuC [Chloroflexota bacterium]
MEPVVLVVLGLIALMVGAMTAFILMLVFRMQSRLGAIEGKLPKQDSINALYTQLRQIDEGSRQSFERLAGNLGELSQATTQMMEVGKTISSLEDLLKPPKLRGGMGETLLAELLAQILPGNYELQYRFSSGNRVDAVIRLGDGLVPVDAKFPLESFRRMIDEQDEAESKKQRRDFVRAVKKHIDEISDKYILPDEGTYDFALMYIPAENIYYETIIKDDEDGGLFPYASDRRVIPVSPNSFYAYLQVIIRGLRGLRIEERAREIMDFLKRLQDDEVRFRKEFDVLGTHLRNASNKFDDAIRVLDRFEDKLIAVGETEIEPRLAAGKGDE